jgi:hypothetical protein
LADDAGSAADEADVKEDELPPVPEPEDHPVPPVNGLRPELPQTELDRIRTVRTERIRFAKRVLFVLLAACLIALIVAVSIGSCGAAVVAVPLYVLAGVTGTIGITYALMYFWNPWRDVSMLWD